MIYQSHVVFHNRRYHVGVIYDKGHEITLAIEMTI